MKDHVGKLDLLGLQVKREKLENLGLLDIREDLEIKEIKDNKEATVFLEQRANVVEMGLSVNVVKLVQEDLEEKGEIEEAKDLLDLREILVNLVLQVLWDLQDKTVQKVSEVQLEHKGCQVFLVKMD